MPFMVSEAARGTARAECVCFEETSFQHPDPKQGGHILHTEDYYPLIPAFRHEV